MPRYPVVAPLPTPAAPDLDLVSSRLGWTWQLEWAFLDARCSIVSHRLLGSKKIKAGCPVAKMRLLAMTVSSRAFQQVLHVPTTTLCGFKLLRVEPPAWL